MNRIDVDYKEAKKWFFNTARVEKLIGRQMAVGMRRTGVYIMKAARSSIRPPTKTIRVSKPDGKSPPRDHTGWLKRGILAVFDQNRKSAVIGPVKNSGQTSNLKPMTTVPNVLEKGGFVRGRTRIKTKTKGKYIQGNMRIIRIKPRPFMKPALDKAIAKGVLANNLKQSFRVV